MHPLYSIYSDDEAFSDKLPFFVAQMTKKLDMCLEFYDRKDWIGLKNYAHKIAGAYGSYGYPELAEIAKEIEEICSREPKGKNIRLLLSDKITTLGFLSQKAQLVYSPFYLEVNSSPVRS